jgi:hypothetical protein
MEVSGQLHAPADSFPGRNKVTYRLTGWMGSRADLDGFGEEKTSYTCRIYNPDLSARS